jgi:2-amino-4-hydroxy-6-hydroxymethyldihydropteridine diphosphokinase
MKRRAYIGLGANLHANLRANTYTNPHANQQNNPQTDPQTNPQPSLDQALQSAITRLTQSQDILLLQQSDFWRTRPVDATGPDFCNAVIEIETALSAEDLLNHLLAIESEFGRMRTYQNAPRTLDLDLIAMEGICIQLPSLTVPHPRAHERAFVLVPLCQINPSVLLGAQHAQAPGEQAQALKPASHWLAQLTTSQLGDVAPW